MTFKSLSSRPAPLKEEAPDGAHRAWARHCRRAPAQFPTVKLFPGNILRGSARPALCGEVREPAPCPLGTQGREAALEMMCLAAMLLWPGGPWLVVAALIPSERAEEGS